MLKYNIEDRDAIADLHFYRAFPSEDSLCYMVENDAKFDELGETADKLSKGHNFRIIFGELELMLIASNGKNATVAPKRMAKNVVKKVFMESRPESASEFSNF